MVTQALQTCLTTNEKLHFNITFQLNDENETNRLPITSVTPEFEVEMWHTASHRHTTALCAHS